MIRQLAKSIQCYEVPQQVGKASQMSSRGAVRNHVNDRRQVAMKRTLEEEFYRLQLEQGRKGFETWEPNVGNLLG